MPRRSIPLHALALLASVTLFSSSAAAAIVVERGDASIGNDPASGTWTLSAAGASLTLVLDPARDFTVTRLTTGAGTVVTSAAVADSTVTVGGRTLTLGSRASGFVLQEVWAETDGNRLQLNATFQLASAGLRLTRHYAIVSGSAAFEAWTTYKPAGEEPVVLSDLSALQLVVRAGRVRTLTGLQGDAADVEGDAVFTLQSRTLSGSGRIAMGSKRRSSETAVPWVAVEGTRDIFFASLMWSGAWSMTTDRSTSGLTIAAGLGPMTTTTREPVDGPHVVFGAVPGGLSDASAALRSYVMDGIRGGRPLQALVTYNTWFAYGTDITETTVREEMERAAALGVELFVVDAGWYAGAGAEGPSDFEAGLGSWTPDPAKFPGGLRPLRDYAHDLGLKFGIWVEPERVSLDVVSDDWAREEWLATAGGAYGSERTALICLSQSGARRWMLARLSQLVDEVAPDYLKWDNNMWVNCDRADHQHGASGNFAQVNGLYEVLDAMRERYPDLVIENVSGGGNRLDLAMLRYTDVAWMDDRTAPSVHVRHNIEGLSAIFPPAYLLSFVTDHRDEPIHDGPDLSLYVRSRMAGVLGLCFRTADLSEGDAATLAREIAIYKSMRDTLTVASGSLLTQQAAPTGGPAWDVLQATAQGDQSALLCAYQSDQGVERVTVKPVGLDPDSTYEVVSVDAGTLGEATGRDLMSKGIEIVQSPNTAAHILRLRLTGQ